MGLSRTWIWMRRRLDEGKIPRYVASEFAPVSSDTEIQVVLTGDCSVGQKIMDFVPES